MDYRLDRLYGAFLHRELAVSWLALSILMGGRHRWDLRQGRFTALEFGCGHGLNLIFNAAAHPEAQFFGIDFHPGHVAMASTRARELGLGNVHFALADLRDFSEGRPERGPCRTWPEVHDLVLAHGVASWVAAPTREALLQAASRSLQPGGLFYCSYNTYPGWLSRSPLQMLALELGLGAGGNTSEASLQQAAGMLRELLDSGESDYPLGRAMPELKSSLESLAKAPTTYLVGEYQATHQPLYVGPLHRSCAEVGLSYVGSASMPELFPQMLDPCRASWVAQAQDPPTREILFDLAINQSFRRDLFARGVVPPHPVELRAELAALPLSLRRDSLGTRKEFPTSMGVMEIDAEILQGIHQLLTAGVCGLGDLAAARGCAAQDLLPQLSLLLQENLVAADPFAALATTSQPGLTAADAGAVSSFNQKLIELASAGKGAVGLLAPDALLPIPLEDIQILLAQVEGLGLGDADRVQMVWLGIQLAGLRLHDGSGKLLQEDAEAMAHLQKIWEAFRENGMEDLRRLGIC
ncbi:MAG: class I SAM-dependent methyltransferase [Prochlorococcaceae cyanobacterium]|jgi:SAM-dependent methyltransferase